MDRKKEEEAVKLKTLAEESYTSSPATNLNQALAYATRAHNLSPSLDGLSDTLTAFRILNTAPTNWYEVLQTDPFSDARSVKRQYRKIALTLRPHHNPSPAFRDAFNLISQAYSVLSDRASKTAHDTQLRISMQQQVEATEGGGVAERESFWTLCVTCRLMHQFERKYLGFNLVCPGCNKSFKALEIDFEYDINRDKGVGEVLERSMPVNGGLGPDIGMLRSKQGLGTRVLGDYKLKKAKNAEEGISLNNGESSGDIRELRPKRRVGTGYLGKSSKFKRAEITEEENMLENGVSNGGIRELRLKRGVRTKGLGERRANMEDSEEEDLTLAEVLKRLMRENGNGGGISTSERGASKLKKGEVEEEGIVYSEMFERSTPENGESRTKRGVGTRGTNESSKLKRFEIQDERPILERSVPEKSALCSKDGVFRSKTMQKGVVFDGKSVSMRDAWSKRVEIGGEESTLVDVFERSISANSESDRVLRPKRGFRTRVFEEEIVEEGITLAEMQMRAIKKVREEKMRSRVKEKREKREKADNKKRRRVSADVGMEIMPVIDSDFYDFDKDRVAKSFKKGQVWAVYDDDDGMPRHYGLIDEVSVYPFKIRLLWLYLESSSNGALLSWDKSGVRVSCGRFKVAETDIISSVNIFSHSVTAERVARELYRIYPKKGSVWALFNENTLQNSDKRCYDIVVCLTSYDETYGLSMGYLEKVDGFKTVFKRREVGSHAVKWLEKPDFRLFSHQIPATKLSGEETSEILRDCWELDPASLPPELLSLPA